MKVGYYFGGYPDKRNIINKVSDFEYQKVYDFNRFINFLSKKINKKILKQNFFNVIDNNFSFNDYGLNNVDLIHFFNAISYSNTPWVSTFETIIPRFRDTLKCHHGEKCGYTSLKNNKRIIKALEKISDNSCKKIIALSNCNLVMQKDFLWKHSL